MREEEHHHLKRVARVKVGENIWLFDNEGNNYFCRVDHIGHDFTRLLLLEKKKEKSSKKYFNLGQSLLKQKSMDLIIQKATELGVSTIIPVLTHRTIVKIEDKTPSKMMRWQRIIRESAKQCGRAIMPSILSPEVLIHMIEKRTETKKILLSEKGDIPLKNILSSFFNEEAGSPHDSHSLFLLIGPEGGWTEEEEIYILERGFEAASLSSHILRAETAAISSMAIISHYWNL